MSRIVEEKKTCHIQSNELVEHKLNELMYQVRQIEWQLNNKINRYREHYHYELLEKIIKQNIHCKKMKDRFNNGAGT